MTTTKQKCKFPECNGKVSGRGYCPGHYRQLRLGQELRTLRPSKPKTTDTESWCGKCKSMKNVDQFGWDKVRNQYSRTCRPCRSIEQRDYVARNIDQVRLRITLRDWGLTEDQYNDLFEAQDHKCAICGAVRRDWRNLAFDHNHKTGELRGLLCQDCNLGIGQLNDDVELLKKAVAYLESGGVLAGSGLGIPAGGRVEKRTKARDAKRARRIAEEDPSTELET